MTIFKKIFDSNKKELIDRFFKNAIIKKLWKVVMKNYKYSHCFGKKAPVADIRITYSEITRLVT